MSAHLHLKVTWLGEYKTVPQILDWVLTFKSPSNLLSVNMVLFNQGKSP